jgi:SAM-dependent methyltransferase
VRRLFGLFNSLLDWVLDHATDRRLRIDTGGYKHMSEAGHVHYGTLPYRGSMAVLRALPDVTGRTLVDIGSGKGRFLCCAARFPFARVIGIEYDRELCEVSLKNARSLRLRVCDIEVVNCLAQNYSYGSGDFYYLYNPFSAEILRRVIERIGTERTGPVVLIYVNPRHEAVLHEFPWLERYDFWDTGAHGIRGRDGGRYQVSFWRSRSVEPAIGRAGRVPQ